MPNYKDTENKLHWLDSSEFEHLLPAGCVKITDEEAEVLRQPPPPTAEELRAIAKQARSQAVEAITVTTTAGNTFDGDETSQGRMARAIIALNATGTPSVTWVLSDNSVIHTSAAELTEALALAGAAQAAIWVI